jgi:hypothetical protein
LPDIKPDENQSILAFKSFSQGFGDSESTGRGHPALPIIGKNEKSVRGENGFYENAIQSPTLYAFLI